MDRDAVAVARMRQVTDEMKTYVWPHLIGIFGIIREGQATLWGSATLVAIGERRLILTAAHVLNPKESKALGIAKMFQYYGHSAGYAKPPRKICEINRIEDIEHDLMVVEVEPGSVEDIGRTPLDTSAFSASSGDGTNALYFFEGFPGDWSVEKPIDELHDDCLPCSTVRVHEAERLEPKPFIYLHYSLSDGRRNDTGQPIRLPDPGGLSGSAFWHTGWTATDAYWSVTQAKVAGVLTKYHDGIERLTAAPVEAVHSIIAQWQAKFG